MFNLFSKASTGRLFAVRRAEINRMKEYRLNAEKNEEEEEKKKKSHAGKTYFVFLARKRIVMMGWQWHEPSNMATLLASLAAKLFVFILLP